MHSTICCNLLAHIQSSDPRWLINIQRTSALPAVVPSCWSHSKPDTQAFRTGSRNLLVCCVKSLTNSLSAVVRSCRSHSWPLLAARVHRSSLRSSNALGPPHKGSGGASPGCSCRAARHGKVQCKF